MNGHLDPGIPQKPPSPTESLSSDKDAASLLSSARHELAAHLHHLPTPQEAAAAMHSLNDAQDLTDTPPNPRSVDSTAPNSPRM